MKTAILLIAIFLNTVPLLADDAQRAPTTIHTIVKERIAVLTQIIETTKKQYTAGEATEEEILNATLELYSLNRDSSKIRSEQISWQERIVATEKKKKALLEQLASSGNVGPVDVLRATERVLAAEQKRLELVAMK
jgi:hypothetical protein